MSEAEQDSAEGGDDAAGSPLLDLSATDDLEALAAQITGAAQASSGPRTTAYDFKRPERVGKDQMRSLRALHEGLARNLGATLSGMLRTMTEVKLFGVDQLTYSEFIYSLENPSCFNLLRPDPLDGSWVLDISPSLAFSMIDRMLGGDPQAVSPVKRQMTPIELKLINRVTRLVIEQLEAAWSNVAKLEITVDRVESNPQIVQIVPPTEVIILIGLEVIQGRIRGKLNLCIPYTTIERYNSTLCSNSWVGYSNNQANGTTRKTIATSVNEAKVDFVVTLARSSIRTTDLLNLDVGDIITTEKDQAEPLEISIQDVPKFHATAGAFKGKKAVQVTAPILPKRDDRPVQAAAEQ